MSKDQLLMTCELLIQRNTINQLTYLDKRCCSHFMKVLTFHTCNIYTLDSGMLIVCPLLLTNSSYGTHQLQLKRDTRVPRVCRPRNPHALLLHACTFVYFYLLHHEHVRKHTSYVCMFTRFFTHAHASHGIHAKCTQ